MKPQDHRAVRAMLLMVLVFGLLGNAIELLLLGHDETATQVIPLVLTAAGVMVIAWYALADSGLSRLLMRITMVALIVAGVLGMVLHYQGNVEFQKEVDPSLQGFALFTKAIQSKTPPALAPGVLAELGLLGFVCTLLVTDRRHI